MSTKLPASPEQLEYLKLLERKVELQEGLPHLHGYKWYKWARDFFESTNQLCFMSKANQISGSSTQIRKIIHWATCPELWPKLWKTRPLQFWYLYPTRDVAHIEFTKKWEPEFMPRNSFKEHPIYGWRKETYHNRIWAIHFNSGVSIFFKTYGQDVGDLQTGTCWYVALDEELPEDLWSELSFRVAATNGHISGVFTPTLGQEFWREAMEETGKFERFKGAFKQRVSMYDCLQYEDGTPSPWTMEQIKRAEMSCKNEIEIKRRVHGYFVADTGLKYSSYSRTRNRCSPVEIPKDWIWYCGVDSGSGGADNHPAAISVVAVSPDYKKGYVVRGWRGDGEDTTSGYIVNKCFEMIKDLPFVTIYYDYSDRDFFTIAQTMGLHVYPAEKGHTVGEQVVNVLFKNDMLMVYNTEDLDPLSNELCSLKKSTPKTRAKDDAADSLRYAVVKVPWDFSAITVRLEKPKSEVVKKTEDLNKERRREFVLGGESTRVVTIEDELDSWNELLESGYGDYAYG